MILAAITNFELGLIIVSSLFLPVIIWSLVASFRVNSVYKKYNAVKTESGMTGAEAARAVLENNGVFDVDIRPVKGTLSDHYDPRSNTINLSEAVFHSNSVSAVGIAAHEAGHAVQYAKNYHFIRLRTAVLPIVSFSSKWAFPLIMISLILEIFMGGTTTFTKVLLLAAVIFYGVYAFFTLITLPIEYNASSRAKKMLVEGGILTKSERAQTAKVLGAAAQTYLAAFFLSVVQFARILLLLLARRK